MSALFVYDESDPQHLSFKTTIFEDIAGHLARVGISFERWTCRAQLGKQAGQAEILAAYAPDIERLEHERGYRGADVVRLQRDASDPHWEDKARAARSTFLEEHCHSEDEVRLFVEGSGLFYMRTGGKVHLVMCEQGNLISVPAGMRHWFDMGSHPSLCAIRIFGSTAGWVAAFTGDPIARNFPTYDDVAPRCR